MIYFIYTGGYFPHIGNSIFSTHPISVPGNDFCSWQGLERLVRSSHPEARRSWIFQESHHDFYGKTRETPMVMEILW